MPTCTPFYDLPFIIGTDRPCDQSATWCAFAAAVDAELDRFDDIVDRTIDTIPMAQIRLTLPRTQAANPGGGLTVLVPFDTVDVDTDNMVDLAASPFTITLSRFGVYMVYFTVEGTTAGSNIEWRIAAEHPTDSVANVASQRYLDDTSTPVVISSAGMYRYLNPVPAGTSDYTTADARLVLSADAAGAGLPLTAVTFGVYWMRDLP